MFRMTPGAGISLDGRTPSGRSAAWGGVAAAAAVATLGYLSLPAVERRASPSETASAQRAAAAIAGSFRARIDFDRRDRTFLVSYTDGGIMDADRIASAVCDTIRSRSDVAGDGQILRDWQVVALPAGSAPGSCRIGGLR
jgi:hypothetical protein